MTNVSANCIENIRSEFLEEKKNPSGHDRIEILRGTSDVYDTTIKKWYRESKCGRTSCKDVCAHRRSSSSFITQETLMKGIIW